MYIYIYIYIYISYIYIYILFLVLLTILLLVVSLKTYKINHCLDCNDKCFVYLLTWNKWNNYKSKSKSFKRGEKCIQEHLYKHFESEGYTEFLDVSITLTDKADGSIPTNREWCEPMCTLQPECCRFYLAWDGDVGREEIYPLLGISRMWILTSI